MLGLKIITILLLLVMYICVNAQDNKYEDHYKRTADELAKNLKARIGLSDEQTTDIKNILIDYNKRVWGIKYNLVPAARNKNINHQNNTSKSKDNTDPANQKTARGNNNTQNNQTPEQKQDEFKGTTRDNDTVSYYGGLGRLEIENLRNADRDVDEKIVNVLNTEQQKRKYLDVKIDWWAVVKDKVYNTKYNSNLLGEPQGEFKPEDQKK